MGSPSRAGKIQPHWLSVGLRDQVDAAGAKQQWKVSPWLLLLPMVR